MAVQAYVTGPWRNVEPTTATANPGFQFTGNPQPDASGNGYRLTPDTALAASQSVEWMRDPTTGQVYSNEQDRYDRLTSAVATKGLTADDEATGSGANDFFSMAGGDDKVFAREGNDWIDGGAGNDTLFGQEGDDTIVGGSGSNQINAGAGHDTVVLDVLDGAGFQLFRDASNPNTVYAIDIRHKLVSTIVEAEAFQAADQTIDGAQVRTFDPLAYAAGYNDLARSFRLDTNAATSHYLAYGAFQGLERRGFDAQQYLKNYADLKAGFGEDLVAATRHFLSQGVDEHRLAESPLEYIASFADLIVGLRGGTQEALKTGGLAHYQAHGFAEGRREGITFDADQYLKNYADLRNAFGTNDDAATTHFINSGFAEHRLSSDPLIYIASSDDLVRAFGSGSGTDQGIIERGLQHYAGSGYQEGRATNGFDVDAYLNRYADLRAVFADGHGGYNEDAATLHYIRYGFFEGRSDDWIV